MPLHLVTGPANAAKAGLVLDAARARGAASPLLVVPTFADMETYRRELASGGAVLGVRIEQFGGLLREMARRGGVGGRVLTSLQAERVAAAAIAATPLRRLGDAATTPGFAAALHAFTVELGEARISPPRLVRALRDWAAEDPARRAYADDLGALVLAHARTVERTGRRDAAGHATAVLDALRLEPGRWGATPVLFYGFDDLTPLQRDAVDTLANAVGADVLFALTFEPGRTAFAARATLHQELLALGATEERLPASAAYYARPALHHLERGLYEPEPRRVPADGVLALEGGGERAEVELVAAEVARLVHGEGVAPGEIAVVHRGLDQVAPLLEQVFRAYDLPIALRRSLRVGHTALGRGLVALLRCALGEASADDLLAWLRTPGVVRTPAFVDRLEARARRDGARTAREARALWEQEHWPLDALDQLAEALQRGGARALAERLAAEAATLLAAPWRREAPVFDDEGELEARVAARVRGALRELADLPGDLQPEPAALAATLEGLEVFVGASSALDRVTIAKPQSVRARRVRALFCLGLQEGVFPQPARPEPLLGDDDRRAINVASGVRLRLREDALSVERAFFYAAVSRPTDLLALSWHAADDEGAPAVRSLLVDDVADLLEEGWAARPRRRELGAAGWPADTAPTEREAARHAAAAAPAAAPPQIRPLRSPAVLSALRERHTWSASDLEAWASCPVRWFVDRYLRPEALVPDPEPMIRGGLAHRVLERALSALVADGRLLSPDHLPQARALVRAALAEHADDFRISPNPERLLSALRRLEVDLVRYLEYAAHAGSALRPTHFELQFGRAEDPYPPLELDDGALRLAGRIDRVDVAEGGREAIVYDYKGRTATAQARWLEEGKLQVGLYLLAVRQLLGLDAVGGLYQPLGAKESDQRPRGAVLREADPGLDTVATDRVTDEELDALLDGCVQAAREAVQGLRAGALAPSPDTCAYQGGCAYPTICRCGST